MSCLLVASRKSAISAEGKAHFIAGIFEWVNGMKNKTAQQAIERMQVLILPFHRKMTAANEIKIKVKVSKACWLLIF